MGDRYGVFVDTEDPAFINMVLSTLGTRWYLTGNSSPAGSQPPGHRKLLVAFTLALSPADAAAIAQQNPGSVWYLLGEPNVLGPTATNAVQPLHDLYVAIKAADPTAKLTSPAVLNWDFTCIGCGGYQSGRSWMNQFRAEYLARYGTEPPFDIFAIDTYPIDWVNLPSTNAQIVIDQLTALRSYINGIPQHVGKPIWIMELSLHWGWSSINWVNGLPYPAGTYQTNAVINYLRTVYDWLEANANSSNIQRWFQHKAYLDLANPGPWASSGLTLFDGPGASAQLTEVGRYYRDRVVAALSKPW
jgi:hypothetical protein